VPSFIGKDPYAMHRGVSQEDSKGYILWSSGGVYTPFDEILWENIKLISILITAIKLKVSQVSCSCEDLQNSLDFWRGRDRVEGVILKWG
jgi:hypothetical protein